METRNKKIRYRYLSNKFINALHHGLLEPLLRCVHTDDVLDLQIRENYINIYYRGGNLIQINETQQK